jgi:CheY-specific phosphatase CheX
LYAAPTLAQHIAQAYVGEPAATTAAANDALTEFAISVAGAVCEAVDAQGIDIEVIAPLVGGHPDVSVDTAVTVEMAGPHGTLIASIIAIARPPSDWPI